MSLTGSHDTGAGGKLLGSRCSVPKMICVGYEPATRCGSAPSPRPGDVMAQNDQAGKPTVVVVGGGYGGTAVAKALDETSNVVLVEPKDAFTHNIAALRALVDPSWLPRIFLPYDGLLTHGRVVRDRAAVVDPHRVVTASGEE